MTDIAYKSHDPRVIEAWLKYLADAEVIRQKRLALSEQEGRNLYVNYMGFGHGTRVVGFERFESDQDGDLLADGALIVSKEAGQHRGLIVPNLRRKSGREYATHLKEYNSPQLLLPGMPPFHIGGVDGIRVLAPMVFHEDIWGDENPDDSVEVYALWPDENVPVVCPPWEAIPLSEFYVAKEKHDADIERKNSEKKEQQTDAQ